jgi:two-component sensor histidine kinase
MEHWPEIAWIPCLLSGSLCLTAGLHLWRFREDPTLKPIIALMASMSWWAICYALALRLESLPAKDFFMRLVSIGAFSAAISFLFIGLQFSSLNRLANRRTLLILLVVPVLAVVLNLTNHYHQIITSPMRLVPGSPLPAWEPHWGYWLLILFYSVLLSFISVVLILKNMRQAKGLQGKRLRLVTLALAPTWIAACLYNARIWPQLVDPTPFLFGFCALVVMSANFRFRTPTPEPLAENLEASYLQLKLFSLRVASVVVTPTLSLFIANEAIKGDYPLVALMVIMLLSYSSAMVAMRPSAPIQSQLLFYNVAICIGIAAYGLMSLYLLVYKGEVARGSWVYLFPILALLGYGAKGGIIMCLAHLSSLLLLMKLMGNMEILRESGFGGRFIIVYLCEAAFLFFFERNRGKAITGLYAQRDALIASERQVMSALHDNEALLKEVHHRVKNNMQVISSMLKLQAIRLEQPELAGAFIDSQSRVHAMSLIHEMLYQQNQYAYVDLKRYLQRLSRHLLSSYSEGQHRLQLDIKPEEVFINLDQAVPLGLIVNELLTNTLKHAFPEGRKGVITIAVHKFPDGEVELRVADDGIGFPSDFDWRQSQSLGLKMMIGLAEKQLHGKIEMLESPGSCFILRFASNSLH